VSLTFQLEPVATAWNELMALATEHWAGTKTYRRHFPFQPSFDRYQACNEQGFFHLFTARDGAALAGYFGVYVTPSMHSQHLMATEDVFYLRPAYRKGREAIRFIRHIEEQCRAWGVEEIMFSCEAENPSNQLLKYLDYQPVIQQYSKLLCVDKSADAGHTDPQSASDPHGGDTPITSVKEVSHL
jgi:GNAT superfamily N-acetyltransferase